MDNNVKNFKEFINENSNNSMFLGYHSSINFMTSGHYEASVLDTDLYPELIRHAYLGIISDYDEYLENDDIESMNNAFEERGLGFTFVSKYIIMGSPYQSSEYKYGDYLYKVYGDGSEILLDDINELEADIIVTDKPLYFEMVGEPSK
jgi:hypothetical protein